MPTLRERIGTFISGRDYANDIAEQQAAIDRLFDAYLDGPYELPPDELIRQLGEYAPVIDEIYGWDVLAGYQMDTTDQRRRALNESRRLWMYNPLAIWTVNTWTSFGLGEGIKITAVDEDANEVWQEAFKADRNSNIFADDNIHELSTFTCVDGNIFIAAYASTLDGETTFVTMDTDEITEIVTDPDNKTLPLYYKREWSSNGKNKIMYYPDWSAYFNDKTDFERANLPDGAITSVDDEEGIDDKPGTVAVMLHIAFNKKDRKSLWGWPLFGAGGPPFIRSHRRFMEDRLTVAASKAMYVRRKTVTGGSRAVASVRDNIRSRLSSTNSLETNPAAVAGSTEIENTAVTTSDLPMTTGGSDAKSDHEMFAWMALLSGGIFPTTAGLDTSRWATAITMDKTQAVQWKRYQTFLSAQFSKMVKITLRFVEKWSKGATVFQSYQASIQIDTLSLVDLPDLVTPLASLSRDAIYPYLADGTLPQNIARELLKQMWFVVFQAMGIADVDEMLSDDAFEAATNGNVIVPQEVQNILDIMAEKYGDGEIDIENVIAFFEELEVE